MTDTHSLSFGWIRDYPDFRDYSNETEIVKNALEHIPKTPLPKAGASADLRRWFSPIEAQGEIGSCTAHSGVGLLEYFERRTFGKHLDASRLFLYKTTRNLMGVTGDTGAYLRDVMKALVLFGVPPESYWPYNTKDFEKEPTAFIYAMAQSFKTTKYYRLDTPGMSPKDVLTRIKSSLYSGLPSMFGFSVYTSISSSFESGAIPFPSDKEDQIGGHAIICCGLSDSMAITNPISGEKTTGAFLIRNSWGPNFGQGGYGWLPYQYVLSGLAVDWWSLVKSDWVDISPFDAR